MSLLLVGSVFHAGTPSCQRLDSCRNHAQLITDSYVPAGATSFHAQDATPFTVGQEIYVSRTVTKAWIDLLGMQNLFGAANQQDPLAWVSVGSNFKTPRTIRRIDDNLITLDIPVSDSIDANHVSGYLAVNTWTTRIQNVGLEHLQIVSPAQTPVSKVARP